MRKMSLEEVNFALADIKETLDIWKHESTDHPYVAQLLREWDEMLGRKDALRKAH